MKPVTREEMEQALKSVLAHGTRDEISARWLLASPVYNQIVDIVLRLREEEKY